MAMLTTEINRIALFRSFAVTEIHRSPYGGRMVSAVSVVHLEYV